MYEQVVQNTEHLYTTDYSREIGKVLLYELDFLFENGCVLIMTSA